jgi:hypothetical protein
MRRESEERMDRDTQIARFVFQRSSSRNDLRFVKSVKQRALTGKWLSGKSDPVRQAKRRRVANPNAAFPEAGRDTFRSGNAAE